MLQTTLNGEDLPQEEWVYQLYSITKEEQRIFEVSLP